MYHATCFTSFVLSPCAQVPQERGKAAQERWLAKQHSKGVGKGQPSGAAACSSGDRVAEPIVEEQEEEEDPAASAHECDSGSAAAEESLRTNAWMFSQEELDEAHFIELCEELESQPPLGRVGKGGEDRHRVPHPPPHPPPDWLLDAKRRRKW